MTTTELINDFNKLILQAQQAILDIENLENSCPNSALLLKFRDRERGWLHDFEVDCRIEYDVKYGYNAIFDMYIDNQKLYLQTEINNLKEKD